MARRALFVVCLASCGGSPGDPDAGEQNIDAAAPDAADLDGPPETAILSGGPPAASLPFATFVFESTQTGTFECSIDGAAFAPCESPQSYADLAYGAHQFQVRAVDRHRMPDPTPAVFDWTASPFGYETLSETGLYADIAGQVLAPDVVEFAPTHPLWSDGAVKTRWLRLPPGMAIDTSAMDAWELPVGTQLWKEFRAPDGTLIETRLIERRRSGGNVFGWEDYVFAGSFQWRLDETDADFAPDGAEDVNGTELDIPTVGSCDLCHRGQTGFVLGLSAVQLSRRGSPGEMTLASLAADGRLSAPPPPGQQYPVPGNAGEQAALGFLHANCGHCHNPLGWAFPVAPGMDLLVRTTDSSATDTSIYQTTVNELVVSDWDPPPGMTLRIAPGDAEASAIAFRPSVRDSEISEPGARPDQMPPFATEQPPEAAALAALRAWIDGL